MAEAGKVDLGRQRHPDWHMGDHPRPYLRVANVFEDRLDRDVMEMDFPPNVFKKFKLQPGDILLDEGQSPHLLGRPAMYRGQPKDIAFTNSLLRFRANPDVLPEWALLVFRHYMHSGRFTREVRITTNIADLSASRFKSIESPIPPLPEQQHIVEVAYRDLSHQTIWNDHCRMPRPAHQRCGMRYSKQPSGANSSTKTPTDEPTNILIAHILRQREVPALTAKRIHKPRTQKATTA